MNSIKKLRTILISLIVGAPMVLTPLAYAESSTSASPATITPAPTTSTKTLAERVADAKTLYKIKLDAATTARLKLKCKAGQVLVKSLDIRVKATNIEREAAYTEIQTNLKTLLPKLTDANISTTEYVAESTQLDTLIATYKTDLATYQSTLADLSDVTCVTDPAAFKAALEAARAARIVVAKDAVAIRAYVTTTIKPNLVKIKADLNTKKTAGSSDTAGSN